MVGGTTLGAAVSGFTNCTPISPGPINEDFLVEATELVRLAIDPFFLIVSGAPVLSSSSEVREMSFFEFFAINPRLSFSKEKILAFTDNLPPKRAIAAKINGVKVEKEWCLIVVFLLLLIVL